MNNVFTVGEVVSYSGVYRITHFPPHTGEEVLTLKKGSTFPRCVRPPGTCNWRRSTGAGTGDHYVRHSIDFNANLAIQRSREDDLVRALREDILRTLAATHTHVTKTDHVSNSGYYIAYEIDNSVGAISVHHPSILSFNAIDCWTEAGNIRITMNVVERWNEWALFVRNTN